MLAIMQSPAVVVRGSQAGLQTFSRRSKRLANPLAHSAGASGQKCGTEGPTGLDGKLNFPVRKRRQGISVNKLHESAAEKDETSAAAENASSSVVVAAVAGIKTSVTKCSSRVKVVAVAEKSLEATSLGSVELAKSKSRTRRVFKKNVDLTVTQKLPEAEVGLSGSLAENAAAATTDFWHSSLSGTEPVDSIIRDSVVGAAVAPILAGKTLSAAGDVALALEHLKSADPLLKAVIEAHDTPKFEKCDSAFAALARSIVYQQLATKAAAAIFGRLVALCEGMENLSPPTISQLSAEQLRGIGISGRKASYLHDLAANFLSGALSDSAINEMDDESLMKALTAVKGIGLWSVHMFMLFSLHKADVLPVSDLGVRKGLQKLYHLKELPTPAQAEKIAFSWQPYRSLGSWYMWRVAGMPSEKPKP